MSCSVSIKKVRERQGKGRRRAGKDAFKNVTLLLVQVEGIPAPPLTSLAPLPMSLSTGAQWPL